MSGRPKPRVLNSVQEGASMLEICEAEKFYFVVFDGQPVNIRRNHIALNRLKYGRLGYVNKAHAYREAARLNKKFKTDLFNVIEI